MGGKPDRGKNRATASTNGSWYLAALMRGVRDHQACGDVVVEFLKSGD